MKRYRFSDGRPVKTFSVAGHHIALTPADAEYLRDRLNDALEEHDYVTPGEAAYNAYHHLREAYHDWELENGTSRARWEEAAHAAYLVAKEQDDE